MAITPDEPTPAPDHPGEPAGRAAPAYVGRFAPSPTGPLHFGSLVAAVGSYLHAAAAGGRWLLRIEDVDGERNVPGAEEEIVRALDAHGFGWDGPILRQSERSAIYAEVLEILLAQGMAYPCACSRAEIERAAAGRRAVDGGLVYPGSCRSGLADGRPARALRLRVPAPDADEIGFVDGRLGPRWQRLARDVGDFVLKRADGPYAYQLAVVVDDALQGVSDVVRGADLIDSTPRQIWLQRCLGVPTPRYLHLPVVTDDAGHKLSKQTRAPAISPGDAGANLYRAFRFLGVELPASAQGAPVGQVWPLAIEIYRETRPF